MRTNNIPKTHLIYFGCLLAVLPMFFLRDFTLGNELRYLSIADESLRNGTLFTFTNHGTIYADKPPLYLWILMFGKSVLGSHNMLFLGLFSIIPAIIIMVVMDNWVKHIWSVKTRMTALLMLLTCTFFIGSGIVLRMDMLMTMFIVLSLRIFFKIYEGKSNRYDWLLFTSMIFMAIFTKGPLGIIIPLVSTIVFLSVKGKLSTFWHYWNWKTCSILLGLLGLWLLCVYSEGGGGYLKNLLFNQTINRAVNASAHKEPFFFYVLSFFYSLAPWSLIILGIFIERFRIRHRNTDLELFFLLVAISTFVVLSLFSSKLDIYLLPAFPFFVYTAMLWLNHMNFKKWMKWLIFIPAFIISIFFPVLVLAFQFSFLDDIEPSFLIYIAALSLTVSGITAIHFLIKNNPEQAIINLSSGILVAVFVGSFALPSYNKYIGLRQICDLAKTEATKSGIYNYYFVGMTRCENLDVYLDEVPKSIKALDLYSKVSKVQKPAIVFTREKAINRNDTIREFLNTHKNIRSGNFYFFKIEE